MIDLSCLSAVHPLTAAVTERCKLLGAGIAKRIPAEKDALIDRLALTAAGADNNAGKRIFDSVGFRELVRVLSKMCLSFQEYVMVN